MSHTIDELRAALLKIHRLATAGSNEPYMSIPPNPERDADLIVMAAIDELASLRAARDALKAENGTLFDERNYYREQARAGFDQVTSLAAERDRLQVDEREMRAAVTDVRRAAERWKAEAEKAQAEAERLRPLRDGMGQLAKENTELRARAARAEAEAAAVVHLISKFGINSDGFCRGCGDDVAAAPHGPGCPVKWGLDRTAGTALLAELEMLRDIENALRGTGRDDSQVRIGAALACLDTLRKGTP